jgi:Baseplate J-like protein
MIATSAGCGCAGGGTWTCGCCDGIGIFTPVSEFNPPGQDALTYRVGTHFAFCETMLARLSNLAIDVPAANGIGTQTLYPLRTLTARDTSDPAIALLDAWAVVADVLSFYQERIANEGYLPTAHERRSILELARLIGYRLRPGVAASVYLAFTAAQDFAGDIPVGTRAQSVPGPGERPQFFETSDQLAIRAEWNAMKPRLTRPQLLSPVRRSLTLAPAVTDVSVIDTLYLDGTATNLKTGNAMLFVFDNDPGGQWLRMVESVSAQANDKRTEIVLAETFDGLDADQKLQLYIDKANYLFEGSALAKDVAAILGALSGNLSPNLVPLSVAQLHEKLNVANERGFSRIAAWIEHIIQLLPKIAGQSNLQGEGEDNADPQNGIKYNLAIAQSSLAASPLGNLYAITSALARPPSVQPANALRLNRTIAQTFSPQSDIAARMLAEFKPAAARALYPAWKSVSKPYGWVDVFAARVATGLFASRFPGQAGVPRGGGVVRFEDASIQVAWPTLSLQVDAPPSALALDGVFDEIKPGSWVAIDRPILDVNGAVDVQAGRSMTYHLVVSVRSSNLNTKTGYSAKSTQLVLDPPWPQPVPGSMESLSGLNNSTEVLRDTIVHAQLEPLALAEEPLDSEVSGDTLSLDGVYDGIEPGRWVMVSGYRTDVGSAAGVKASELAMIAAVAQGTEAPLCTFFPSDFVPFTQIFYTTPANAQGDRLVVGAVPRAFFARFKDLPTPGVLNQQYCDQIQLAQGFFVNAYLPDQAAHVGLFPDFVGLLVDPVSGKPLLRGMIPGAAEAIKAGGVGIADDQLPTFFAWRISTPKLHTILKFASPLAYIYDSASVSVYGNVVKATHGQSVGEVLGDGSGAQVFQIFALHQAPLTYLSAPTPDGIESTLAVTVNELDWHERPNLAFSGTREHVFATAADDDDNTSVVFGDGVHGARLPTGTANVKARYRYGIGAVGNVAAEQISQLATQPLGLKSVINPLPASGGADRDSADEARANAPVAVLALDRLVSVKDYADFARVFAGIGKASAMQLTDGRRQFVHVTIAGARDVPIDVNSDLYRNLLAALEAYGDPSLPVGLFPRKLKLLVIKAGVALLPDYEWEAVEPAIRTALLDAYSFGRRDLGQSAFLSEAIRVVQEVEGVSYVRFDIFDSVAEDTTAAGLAGLAGTLTVNQYVSAALARPNPDPSAPDDARFLTAELALLTPAIPDTLILSEIGS